MTKDKKIIVFVRHGQSETNARRILSSAIEGYPLTEKGVGQARFAARVVASLPNVDALYCSPVIRARQTAEIIGEMIGKKPIIDSRLRERWFGLLEENLLPSDKDDEWKFDPGNQISPWSELRARMASFINDVPGRIIVAASHGDNLSAVCDLVDNKGERFHAPRCPRNCHFVVFDAINNRILARDVEEIPKEIVELLK